MKCCAVDNASILHLGSVYVLDGWFNMWTLVYNKFKSSFCLFRASCNFDSLLICFVVLKFVLKNMLIGMCKHV